MSKIHRYLPAGTTITVRDTGGNAREWKTKVELPVPAAETTARCPRTGRPGYVMDAKGYEVFYTADQVHGRVLGADGAEIANTVKACLLYYDIPVSAEITNPSGQLRRYGFRVNLSCWVVPEHNIPYTILHELTQSGASVNVVRFDAAESTKIIGMAVTALRKEMEDTVLRAEQSREDATAALGEATAETVGAGLEAAHTARDKYLRRAKAIKKRIEELREDLEAAAGAFGIPAAALNLGYAEAAVAGIETAMQTRARLYVEAAARLRAANMPEAAAGVEADTMPAGIVADMLQDAGDDAFAQALRASFDGVDGHGVTGGTPDAEEFSLAGVAADMPEEVA